MDSGEKIHSTTNRPLPSTDRDVYEFIFSLQRTFVYQIYYISKMHYIIKNHEIKTTQSINNLLRTAVKLIIISYLKN